VPSSLDGSLRLGRCGPLADVPCAYKPDYPFGKESTASGAGAPGAPMGNVLGMGELMRKKRGCPCRYAPMAT